MKIVVGLGNPGTQYAGTRHNLGFLVVDELSRGFSGTPFVAGSIPARIDRGTLRTSEGAESVLLVKPTTFMNRSGHAVEALAKSGAGEFSPADVLVVLDDVYLPFGRLRLRGAGSAGGHNGLQSVLESLGTTAVPRLRCGVGPAPESADLKEYVLEGFSIEEKKTLPEFVDRAASCARVCLEEGLEAAMNRYNTIEGA
jgi:PTH1 family peptidyl-tRNA hydrolase